MIAGISGTFGVPRRNYNGRRVVEFYAKMGLYVGNTYMEHKSFHKYTRVARGQDGVEVKSMLDLVLVKKDILLYVQDVREVKGMAHGLSYHNVVLCKFRLVGAWIKKRKIVDGTRRIKSEKLKDHQYIEGYDRPLEGKRIE